MSGGVFYGVGVGPGDPELLTLKAAGILKKADVIAAPSGGERRTALEAAAAFIEGKPVLDCPIPMSGEGGGPEAAYEKIADAICGLLAEGRTVAYVTLGDPSIYSTYLPLRELINARGFAAYTVPGVPAFCAAAAVMNRPLCKGRQRLLIAPAGDDRLEDCVDFKAAKVFMRPARAAAELKRLLCAKGCADRCRAIANCGLPGERIFESLDELEDTGYFTMVFVSE